MLVLSVHTVNSSPPSAAYMRQWLGSVLVLKMGFSPIQRQAITWTNANLLSIEPLETNFSEIWIKVLIFSFRKMCLKMSCAKMVAILSRGEISYYKTTTEKTQWQLFMWISWRCAMEWYWTWIRVHFLETNIVCKYLFIWISFLWNTYNCLYLYQEKYVYTALWHCYITW